MYAIKGFFGKISSIFLMYKMCPNNGNSDFSSMFKNPLLSLIHLFPNLFGLGGKYRSLVMAPLQHSFLLFEKNNKKLKLR